MSELIQVLQRQAEVQGRAFRVEHGANRLADVAEKVGRASQNGQMKPETVVWVALGGAGELKDTPLRQHLTPVLEEADKESAGALRTSLELISTQGRYPIEPPKPWAARFDFPLNFDHSTFNGVRRALAINPEVLTSANLVAGMIETSVLRNGTQTRHLMENLRQTVIAFTQAA